MAILDFLDFLLTIEQLDAEEAAARQRLLERERTKKRSGLVETERVRTRKQLRAHQKYLRRKARNYKHDTLAEREAFLAFKEERRKERITRPLRLLAQKERKIAAAKRRKGQQYGCFTALRIVIPKP